jgi:hypothetical protein
MLPLVLALALAPCPVAAANSAAQTGARDLVNAKARQLFLLHRREIKALERTLRNTAFRDFFVTTDPARQAQLRGEIEQASRKLQHFSASEEICLIDRTGHELVRLVDGALEPHINHGQEARHFFEAAFTLPEGDVLVSRVYPSHTLDRWVFAYVTPVKVAGENVALLHYAQELASFVAVLGEDLDGARQALLVVDESGRVLFDSRQPQPVLDAASLPDRVGDHSVAAIVAAAEAGAVLDGFATAAKKVRGWTLVALQR